MWLHELDPYLKRICSQGSRFFDTLINQAVASKLLAKVKCRHFYSKTSTSNSWFYAGWRYSFKQFNLYATYLQNLNLMLLKMRCTSVLQWFNFNSERQIYWYPHILVSYFLVTFLVLLQYSAFWRCPHARKIGTTNTVLVSKILNSFILRMPCSRVVRVTQGALTRIIEFGMLRACAGYIHVRSTCPKFKCELVLRVLHLFSNISY